MLKEVKISALDLGLMYAGTSLIIYGAYKLGKIVAKTEIATKLHEIMKDNNVYAEPKTEKES